MTRNKSSHIAMMYRINDSKMNDTSFNQEWVAESGWESQLVENKLHNSPDHIEIHSLLTSVT